MSQDMMRGHLDGLVLAVLATGPTHGYGLIEALRDRSGGVFDLPEGSVYPACTGLERAGLVASGWSEVGGRRRRVYSLTPPGAAPPRSGAASGGRSRRRWSGCSAARPGRAPGSRVGGGAMTYRSIEGYVDDLAWRLRVGSARSAARSQRGHGASRRSGRRGGGGRVTRRRPRRVGRRRASVLRRSWRPSSIGTARCTVRASRRGRWSRA